MTAYPKPGKRARRPSTMPQKLVQLIIERDHGSCVLNLAGCTRIASLADHRSNRGAGGAAILNHPSVLVASCGLCNNGKEDAHGEQRQKLVRRGLRVIPDSTHQKTLARAKTTPVQYPDGRWFYLREDGGRDETTEPREEEEDG